MFKCTGSIIIKGAAEDIYQDLYNVQEWPKFLPHVKKVVLLETNAKEGDQVMLMTTVTNGKEATMKTRRACIPFHTIRYEQVEPHPLLNYHKGEWKLKKEDGGTLVSTIHEADIKPEAIRNFFGEISADEAEVLVKKNLLKHSLTTLKAIRKRVESKMTSPLA